MKKFNFLFSLLMIFAISFFSAWAEAATRAKETVVTSHTSSLIFTANCNGSGTADDGVVWAITSDGTESNYDNTKGIHYGTSSAEVSWVQLLTTDIPGTIKKVVVKASGPNDHSAEISVKVGSTNFTIYGDKTKSPINADVNNFEFTGSASGQILVLIAQASAKKALYCKSVVVTYETDEQESTYQREITAGQFGTICLPNSGRIEGATIFEIAHTKDGKIFFDEISEATMDAGRPYIFYPNNGASELKVYYTGSENAEAGSYNGLYGSYVQSQLAQNDGNYILYDNKYYLVDSEAYVGANRAYIKLGEVPTEEQAPAPGRRRVSMDVQGEQVATSIINTHYGDQPMKVMIDNQLYIIRAGQMFDMTGNKIK